MICLKFVKYSNDFIVVEENVCLSNTNFVSVYVSTSLKKCEMQLSYH